jgi:hypothetical protein
MKDPGFRGFFYSGSGTRLLLLSEKPAIDPQGRFHRSLR